MQDSRGIAKIKIDKNIHSSERSNAPFYFLLQFSPAKRVSTYMDLHRTLRVSLYLLVGTGAFAISVAERSLFYLALIAVLGVASFLTIDRGKTKPLSNEWTAALTLLLLYLALRPLHDDERWQAHIPLATAHFLCAWQGLLFFSVFGEPMLLTYCGSTLTVVVMSGVVQSGPSLVARMTCFLAVAVWTLYIHSVWRSRQEFAGLPAMLHAAGSKPRGERAGADAFKHLPEGAFWGTLALVLGMTAACIALGVATFFSMPRVDGILALFEKRNGAAKNPNSAAFIEAGSDDKDAPVLVGIGDKVKLDNLGRIPIDTHIALRATFSKPATLLADRQKRILFKGLNFASYVNGEWIPESAHETLESKNGAPIVPRDPSLDGAAVRGEEIQQTIETAALSTANLYAAGPVARVISVRRVEMDAEGSLRNADRVSIDRYTLAVTVPLDSSKISDRAIADHRDYQRYVRQNGLPPNEREAVAQLARKITRQSASDVAKARDIQKWLETHRTYTRNLEKIKPAGDPLAHFLLTDDPEQARGHCGLFASAFVMLCRSNAMPARLCTGYAGHIGADGTDSKTAEAANSDAHAWAEVYFKGIGWVPFDPTPAEPAAIAGADVRTAPALQPKPSAAAAMDAPAEQAPSNGFIQDAWNAMLSYNGYEQRKLYERFSGATGSGSSGFFASGGWASWLGVVLAWLGAGVAIGWLMHFFTRRNTRRKHALAAGGPRARAAVAFYNDLLQALSRRGYSRRPGQTPREFAESVLRRGGVAYAPVREVTKIFETVRYGGGELDQDEFNRLQDALDRIREMTF